MENKYPILPPFEPNLVLPDFPSDSMSIKKKHIAAVLREQAFAYQEAFSFSSLPNLAMSKRKPHNQKKKGISTLQATEGHPTREHDSGPLEEQALMYGVWLSPLSDLGSGNIGVQPQTGRTLDLAARKRDSTRSKM